MCIWRKTKGKWIERWSIWIFEFSPLLLYTTVYIYNILKSKDLRFHSQIIGILGKMPLSEVENDINFYNQMNDQTRKSLLVLWNCKGMRKYLWYNTMW